MITKGPFNKPPEYLTISNGSRPSRLVRLREWCASWSPSQLVFLLALVGGLQCVALFAQWRYEYAVTIIKRYEKLVEQNHLIVEQYKKLTAPQP